MKLYTEEQVHKIIKLAEFGRHITYGELLDEFTPIELPSDEEIGEVARDKINLSNDCFGQYDFTSGKQDGFMEGAEWMRDKIQGGNNEQ